MLYAVHISDGVLTWPCLLGGVVLAAVFTFLGACRMRDEEIPRLGVLTAAFFVASQLHLPVAGVGSAHLLLNGLIAVVLRGRAVVAIAVGLTLQLLLFGHGGWTTLGVNVVVYTLPTLLVGPAIDRLAKSPRLLRPIPRALFSSLAAFVLLGTVLVAAQCGWGQFVARSSLPTSIGDCWIARPEVLSVTALLAVVFGVAEGRLERDPNVPIGLWVGGGTAYATVALNTLVLVFGGRETVRDVASLVFLANLPVIAVEAVAVGFTVAYLARAKPEWLSRRADGGEG